MNKKVDVICQNCKDGSIIPIKIRVEDDDGILQQYIIKSYKEVAAYRDGYNMPNEVRIAPNSTIKKYECRVAVFGKWQKFYLVFNRNDLTWSLEVN